MSFTKIYSTINKICEEIQNFNCFSSSNAQIDYILSEYLNLKNDFNESFVPALKIEISKTKKSVDEAKRLKEFFELYKNMTEPQFNDKAFEYLNKSIIATPKEEKEFLFESFAQRSNLHYHKGDYKESMKDIDNALQIRLSYSLLERKVNILEKLGRKSEAYDIVNNSIREYNLSRKQMEPFKRLRKELLRYKTNKSNKISENEKLLERLSVRTIQIDSRVQIEKNLANHYTFIAKEKIPINTEILLEDPMMITLNSNSLQRFCNNCQVKVSNTFWPCFECQDVVFCTKTCAELAEYHRAECGIVNIMQKELCNEAIQAYRTFAQIGFSNFYKIQEMAKSFSLENCFENTLVDRSLANKWFIMSQFEMFRRIQNWKNLRSANELCDGICLFMIYCYKNNIDMNDFSKKDMIEIIDFFATSILKIQLNEYAWHENNSEHKKIQLANFQCLFGSTINHNCDPNAEWSFDGVKFQIKATKEIDKYEEIAITYGIGRDKDVSLFKRQRHLKNFFIMCSCNKCMKEVKKNFAIRCENCNGPIPYDYNDFVNEICMKCEQNYDSLSTMLMVQNEFKSAKRALFMIDMIENEDLLKIIEKMMSTLACYIYLESEKFSEMVCKLCDRYFQLKMWSPAIEWYQWFRDCVGINLAWNKDDFIYYNNLNKWTQAYLNYFQQQINMGKEIISANYIGTAAHLFDKQFLKLQLIEKQYNSGVFDQLQLKKMVKSFLIDTQERYSQFRQLCLAVWNCKDEKQLMMEDGNTSSITSTSNASFDSEGDEIRLST